jgi:hypothetical protein
VLPVREARTGKADSRAIRRGRQGGQCTPAVGHPRRRRRWRWLRSFAAGSACTERIERSAEESYAEIEQALRRALQGSTKPKGVKCPNCGEGFKVNLPDHAAAIASAKLLLELVVSRPKPPEEPTPLPPWEGDAPDFNSMSTADLYRVAFDREPPPPPSYEEDDDEEVA